MRDRHPHRQPIWVFLAVGVICIVVVVVFGNMKKWMGISKPASAPPSELVVKEMDNCVTTNSSSTLSDNELNRLYKQCWNHSKLIKR